MFTAISTCYLGSCSHVLPILTVTASGTPPSMDQWPHLAKLLAVPRLIDLQHTVHTHVHRFVIPQSALSDLRHSPSDLTQNTWLRRLPLMAFKRTSCHGGLTRPHPRWFKKNPKLSRRRPRPRPQRWGQTIGKVQTSPCTASHD